MNDEFKTWYEKYHNTLMQWNKQREINERKGLEKFYKLKEMFDTYNEKGVEPKQLPPIDN